MKRRPNKSDDIIRLWQHYPIFTVFSYVIFFFIHDLDVDRIDVIRIFRFRLFSTAIHIYCRWRPAGHNSQHLGSRREKRSAASQPKRGGVGSWRHGRVPRVLPEHSRPAGGASGGGVAGPARRPGGVAPAPRPPPRCAGCCGSVKYFYPDPRSRNVYIFLIRILPEHFCVK